jgi:7-carboxy-7-deazaguanine synthase
VSYAVKELYYTLQGEGAHTGRAAVFCRFAGCNLWSGREADRATAVCRFCDTEFVGVDGEGGGRFQDPTALALAIRAAWPANGPPVGRPYVVFTGGEPLLQLDAALIDRVHAEGFEVAIETNGTISVPAGVDWICVSPKADAALVVTKGNELKLVYPQVGAPPEAFRALEFDHFFLQPMDGPLRATNTEAAVGYCLRNPRWRLSLQTHKLVGLR